MKKTIIRSNLIWPSVSPKITGRRKRKYYLKISMTDQPRPQPQKSNQNQTISSRQERQPLRSSRNSLGSKRTNDPCQNINLI
jgi:hypothetical protein